MAEAVPSGEWFEQPALKAVTAKIEAMLLPSDFSFMAYFPVTVRCAASPPTIPRWVQAVLPVINGLNVARADGQWRVLTCSPLPAYLPVGEGSAVEPAWLAATARPLVSQGSAVKAQLYKASYGGMLSSGPYVGAWLSVFGLQPEVQSSPPVAVPWKLPVHDQMTSGVPSAMSRSFVIVVPAAAVVPVVVGARCAPVAEDADTRAPVCLEVRDSEYFAVGLEVRLCREVAADRSGVCRAVLAAIRVAGGRARHRECDGGNCDTKGSHDRVHFNSCETRRCVM